MARSKRMAEEEQDLNLAPIMNMVVILIPLLLLSVVFVQVAVINITAPKLSVGPPSDTTPEKEEKPLNLTVTVAPNGFRISAEGGNAPTVAGCPPDGPTICLVDRTVDVAERFRQGRQKIVGGDTKGGEDELEKGLAAFNWRLLYNELARIKTKYPEETVMNISADPDVPFTAVVRLMDVARFKLEKESYGKDKAFWEAKYKKVKVKDESDGQLKEKPDDLFSDPVLAVAQ